MSSKTEELKKIPISKNSEMMILGCMLTNPDHLQVASERLDSVDFFFNEHKAIFKALKKNHSEQKPVDILLVSEELSKDNLLEEVGGAAYLITLAQFAGTSAYIEEYVEVLKNKSLLRELISESQEIGKEALEDPENALSLIEKFQKSLKLLEAKHAKSLQPISIESRIKELDDMLLRHRGNKYLGLRIKTIDEFNEKLLGLRKLILLAAAPNVGKTALTIQLGLEALLSEPNACLAYFSLEMTSLEIFTRMNLHLSELNFQTLVFGSNKVTNSSQPEAFFSENEFNKIKQATFQLKQLGNRVQIIDQSMCPFIDARGVINFVENLKQTTKCQRAIVIIDYLQVWPFNPNLRFPSENEADKWRIGEMKKIKDAMNDDPVIVISEARKPSGKDDLWGGDLSDVMGSARGTYTPDVVMLLSTIRPKTLSQLWEQNNMPKNLNIKEEIEGSEDEKRGNSIKIFLAQQGISLCKLEVPKARDGMQKFGVLLEFQFNKNCFRKLNWNTLRQSFQNLNRF